MKVETTNEEKIFFPDAEITKGDILNYYDSISELILPYLKDRPLMMQRFPDGIRGEGFYQKEAGDYFPDWIETMKIEKEGGVVNQVICNNSSSLKYLVNQGVLCFHTWQSVKTNINNPDKLIVDLDPPKGDFEIVRDAANVLFEFFNEVDISAYLMTTGSEGLHIMVPLDGKSDFDTVRNTAKMLGSKMTKKHPELFSREQRKSKRKGKLYFDIQRNAYAQMTVSPYTVRPVKSAAVATPLSWDELIKNELNSQSYTVKNLHNRLSQKDDPWKGHKRHKIGIKRLEESI